MRGRGGLHLALGFCAICTAGARQAVAAISVLACQFTGVGRDPMYVTIYDDGSPARIGGGVGVGSRALIYFDGLTGATVVVELNLDGIPITLTTVNRGGDAVHSRHVLSVPEGVRVPSQTLGQCEQSATR